MGRVLSGGRENVRFDFVMAGWVGGWVGETRMSDCVTTDE